MRWFQDLDDSFLYKKFKNKQANLKAEWGLLGWRSLFVEEAEDESILGEEMSQFYDIYVLIVKE